MKKMWTFCLAGAITGFVGSGIFIGEFITAPAGINELFKNIISLMQDDMRWLLVFLYLMIIAAAPVVNLVGWKKNSRLLMSIACIFHVLSLNALSLLFCIIGMFWNRNDETSMQERKKSPLFIAAGILSFLGLLFWFVPLAPRADGTGVGSFFSGMLSYATTGSSENDLLIFRTITISYSIALILSFVIAIAVSFFGKLRNNADKALVAAILYIIPGFTIPSAILCFIAYARLKKSGSA